MRLALLLLIVLGGVTLAAGQPKEPAKDAAEKSDQEKLQGTWKVTSAERRGEKVPEEVQKVRLHFKGDLLSITPPAGTVKELGKFTLAPAAKPATIDVTVQDGPDKGKVIHGIYRFEDGTLKLVLSKPGTDRPKEFGTESAEGRDDMLFVLEREKS